LIQKEVLIHIDLSIKATITSQKSSFTGDTYFYPTNLFVTTLSQKLDI